jgi:hypothetical protein
MRKNICKQGDFLYEGWSFLPFMSHNVLALGAVADFGAQNCQYTTNFDAR